MDSIDFEKNLTKNTAVSPLSSPGAFGATPDAWSLGRSEPHLTTSWDKIPPLIKLWNHGIPMYMYIYILYILYIYIYQYYIYWSIPYYIYLYLIWLQFLFLGVFFGALLLCYDMQFLWTEWMNISPWKRAPWSPPCWGFLIPPSWWV